MEQVLREQAQVQAATLATARAGQETPEAEQEATVRIPTGILKRVVLQQTKMVR